MVGRTMRSAYWLNHDPTGMVEAGYGPATKRHITGTRLIALNASSRRSNQDQ
jgi:hypothetical protein